MSQSVQASDKAAKGKVVRIVKRRRKGAEGHSGGSWKVAYADFVTAMMAFFMVMWLLGMDENMKEAIEGYFANPVGFKQGSSGGNIVISTGNSSAGNQRRPISTIVRAAEEERFMKLASDINERLNVMTELSLLGAKIETVKTNAGLRIELIESGQGQTFFPNSSSVMTPTGISVLSLIGEELARLETPMILEGHTDSYSFNPDATYTNWELSSDRANAARRILEQIGVASQRVTEVKGFADRKLRIPENPYDPANRRISILLPFTDQDEVNNSMIRLERARSTTAGES